MKKEKPSSKPSFSKQIFPALCALFVLAAGYFAQNFSRSQIDNWLYGKILLYKIFAKPFEKSARIVSVDISNDTEEKYEDALDSRKIFLDSMEVLRDAGLKGGGFDFLFSKNGDAEIDGALARSCEKIPGFALAIVPTAKGNTRDKERPSEAWQEALLEKHALRPKVVGKNRIPVALRFTFPAKVFSESASVLGHVGVTPDRDGIYRRTPLFYRYGEDRYIPSYPLAIAMEFLGADKNSVTIDLSRGKVEMLTAEGELISIPVDRRGSIMIPYPCFWADKEKNRRLPIETLFEAAEDDEKYESVEPLVRGNLLMFSDLATFQKDFGTTPLESNYPLAGIHSSILNGILCGAFVTEIFGARKILYFLGIFVLCALFVCIKKTRFFNAAFALAACALVSATMALGIFRSVAPCFSSPFFAMFAAWALSFASRQIEVYKEKSFITRAFSQCLSQDVVDGIVKNPESLKLGGISREMTAIFTDIQKFSGFSELLNAEELVALLNYYLTKMSDIIMEERGTVDKYEGDAIVALVGAPVEMKDHASRACAAALKMKKAEIEMNREMYEIAAKAENESGVEENLFSAFKKLCAKNIKIFTRIGINSGEMVAGFMGSEKKKNYTMMGNNVNLASRLEGVNKQYSTGGILMSEATRNLVGDEFVVRSLDRVQVVNVKTPIRLYELLSTKKDASENLLKLANYWEEAVKTFESGQYQKAREMFAKCAAARQDDNVAKYYVALIEKFFAKGKYPTEADDFGVAYNAENPPEMDSSWIGTKNEIKGTFKLLQK